MPTALVTGVTGQDGAYLSQLLLSKGYKVIGLMRRSASSDVIGERLRWLGILKEVELVDGNLTDLSSCCACCRPTSRTRSTTWPPSPSWPRPGRQPLLTGNVTGIGAANVLEAVRLVLPEARFLPGQQQRECSA